LTCKLTALALVAQTPADAAITNALQRKPNALLRLGPCMSIISAELSC